MTTPDTSAELAASGERRRALRGRLAGKVALISGAGGNIGRTLCRRYVLEGATVIMVGRSREKLEAARDELRRETRATASRFIVLPMDAS
ncbi:MAG: SDR family NAD(P)-dependent oxidoreductase, partial [Gemmatimonadaceae bacterium]|nr:SDR family NAD(P)-dependent oxidoreductase [Gemmatimonadaceae bacterium]